MLNQVTSLRNTHKTHKTHNSNKSQIKNPKFGGTVPFLLNTPSPSLDTLKKLLKSEATAICVLITYDLLMLIPWTLILCSGYYYYSYWVTFDKRKKEKQISMCGELSERECLLYEDIRRQEICHAFKDLLIGIYTMV